MHDGLCILEVGCGNGYVAQCIIERFAVQLDAIDFSKEMIELSLRRDTHSRKGSVRFSEQDILSLAVALRYDLVFTERCLQNLESWNDQMIALANIARALKVGGEFIMLESFWSGLRFLNEARRELDLPDISPPWHNLFFEEEAAIDFLQGMGCAYVDQNAFLSGYYFGSRVLLPALMPKGNRVTSQSRLNDYFCSLPPAGDFSPMKILRFRREK
jgi:SAM-dependent methyltransferase